MLPGGSYRQAVCNGESVSDHRAGRAGTGGELSEPHSRDRWDMSGSTVSGCFMEVSSPEGNCQQVFAAPATIHGWGKDILNRSVLGKSELVYVASVCY